MYISRLDKRNSQNRLLWEFESDINVIISFSPESYSVDVNIRQCIHVFIDIHFGQFLTYLHICKQRYHLLTLRVNLNHSTCNTSHSKLITRHNSLNLSAFKVNLIECNLNFTTKNFKKIYFFWSNMESLESRFQNKPVVRVPAGISTGSLTYSMYR